MLTVFINNDHFLYILPRFSAHIAKTVEFYLFIYLVCSAFYSIFSLSLFSFCFPVPYAVQLWDLIVVEFFWQCNVVICILSDLVMIALQVFVVMSNRVLWKYEFCVLCCWNMAWVSHCSGSKFGWFLFICRPIYHL